MTRKLSHITAICFSLFSISLQAENIKLNGFVTASATFIDSEVSTQDGNITNRASFINDSKFGIQVSADVNPKIKITSQLLASGKQDDFDMKADWAFITYHASDPMSIRFGKLKLTTFLISDYFEIGYAYPWIRPPGEVYSSNPISTINGFDILYKIDVGDGVLLVQPYFGQSKGATALQPQETLQPPEQQPGDINYVNFTADHMFGMNISIGNDSFSARAGYLETLVGAVAFGVENDVATHGSAGVTMDWKNIVGYAEYFERTIGQGANAAFPNQKGYYATLGYRMGIFLPHITHAKLEDNDNEPFDPLNGYGLPLEQVSTTAGIRIELGKGAALKLEVQRVTPEEGSRGLLISNPNNPALDDPNQSVNIYGAAIDAVF